MSQRASAKKFFEEPKMSDRSLIVSVEDLIGMAMGPTDQNVVNYKMVQTVLHILARQLRMLEQQVEIRADMELEQATTVKLTKEEKAAMKAGKREAGTAASKDKDKEKADRAEAREREKEERARAKEIERDGRHSARDKEKAEREDEKAKEKAERAASKERDREEKGQEKEKQKMEKADAKEREKADKAAAKETEKMGKAAEKQAKEAEKMGKATAKELEKMEKATAKEKEKMEKERERAEKAAGKEQKDKGKEESSKSKKVPASGEGSNIAITEAKRGKDKVLVVEKGQTTYADARARSGSIEVVTRSQFELLKDVVDQLASGSGPLPNLVLPDNKTLWNDLAKGTASLTDTMQALQVSARISAAEEAISRMADLLTQLAATGALPEDVASRVVIGLHEAMIAAAEGAARLQHTGTGADGRPLATPRSQKTDVRTAEVHQSMTPRKSVAIDPGSLRPGAAKSSMGARSMAATRSTVGGASAMSTGGFGGPCVSHKEMDDSLQGLREDLSKNIQGLTTKATNNADVAANLAKSVAEKLEVALTLDTRINTLYSLTSDYAEQLTGFDVGLTTQMQSFQEQMAQMRNDLKGGLDILETANNNAETAAVMELTERYEGLVFELDRTSHAHQSLTTFQKQLGEELRSLVECVETLREQKADRDEVQDGLKDKADISRLAGLLRDEDFVAAREEIESRLALCYDKFNKQDAVWLGALRDLTAVTETKAEYLQLMSLRENTQAQINDMNEDLFKLAEVLGEPKAAVLTRKLARDAACGACMGPALMDMQEPTFGEPAALAPLIRGPRRGADTPCIAEMLSKKQEFKGHMCKRWVGGSHTLTAEGVTRTHAPPAPAPAGAVPTRRYAGFGDDGQMYMMEEELLPCVECNELLYEQFAEAEGKGAADAPPAPETGAGDQGPRVTEINIEDVK